MYYGPQVWDERDTNAIAVTRGPLLYAMRLEETSKVVRTWQPFGNADLAFATTTAWK